MRGRFTVKGTDRSVGLFEVAAGGGDGKALPEELRGPLPRTATRSTERRLPVSAAQSARSRSIPTPALVDLVSYTAVDDVGRAINPLILHGQTHGGIAQGVGQALWEQCVYDADRAVLTGSFMDYAMPRADMLPSFNTELSEVLTPTNPLGVRGGGEGGTTPALGAVVNAVVDALAGLRRDAYRHAGDAGKDLARDPRHGNETAIATRRPTWLTF